VLAERRPDRRRRVGLATPDLELDEREDFLRHECLFPRPDGLVDLIHLVEAELDPNQAPRFRRVVVPTEQVIETKDGQKVQIEKRVLPGYVLVNMDLNDEAWTVVKNTPGVTGFVGAGAKPVPLSQPEVDKILHTGAALGAAALRSQVAFELGESVKVTSGPLSDFDGEIVDVNADQQKLKVLVDIFERQVPVELAFDQVKKLD
jgi:transcriptional antiterminator NusG